MPWLFLLLAVAAFAVALKASSMAVVVLCLLAALACTVAWVLGLLAQRMGNRTRDDSMMLDPVEMKRLREQAESRRSGDSGTDSVAAFTPGGAASTSIDGGGDD